jgi:ABC-type lipoprotein export system ATPase subunit
MIEISNINKKYTSKTKEDVLAIQDVNLKFNTTGLVFILGKSGSGKSTFLNILGGLDSANTSRIFLNGKKLNRFNETILSEYRNTYIGFVFQEYNLLDNLNVYDNVALALEMQNKDFDPQTVLDILKKVDLEGFEERELDELSGGQKQRVAVARALVKDPEVILADEPTGNLDSETSEQIFELFKEISKKKLVICVSHDAEYAYKYADRIIEISDGRVIRDTQPEVVEDDYIAPEMIRPVLPNKFVLNMGLGNIMNNKLRMVVTSVIVAFLMAILTAVYTTLSVSPSVDMELFKASKMNHLWMTSRNSETILIEGDRLTQIQNVLPDYGAVMYKRQALMIGDGLLTVRALPINIDANSLQSPLTRLLDASKVDVIKELPLNFIETGVGSHLYDDLIGNEPGNNQEVVISSYLADLIIQSGVAIDGSIQRFTSYTDLISKTPVINLGETMNLKVVGIMAHETPVLNNETIALETVYSNLYVQRGFLAASNMEHQLMSYGIYVTNVASLPDLLKSVKNAGYINLRPIYSDTLQNFTRFELALLISVIVPLIGYLALVFLANYISSSILYRKKQIGILRALGSFISNVEHVFRLEAIIVGFFIMIMAYFLTPYFVDVMNFAFMVYFKESFISFYHFSVFSMGIGKIVEIFLLLSVLITILTFTLTNNINLIDPVDVINGR